MTARPTWRRCAYVATALALAGCASEPAPHKRRRGGPLRSPGGRATSAQKQSDPATASNYYRGALARDPDNGPAAIGLMQTLRLVGALDEARSVATKALAARPDDPGVVAEAGKVRLATGQIDEAIK